MENPEKIRSFILDDIGISGRNELDWDEDLLDSGIVDSLSIVQLVGFIENTFCIKVKASEIVPENFCSIAAIARFVEKKQ